MMDKQALRVGVGGPVGSGKTALLERLCRTMRDTYEIAVVTNDIYTYEDAQFLVRAQALPAERIVGVETGGCPHTAIREDASMNLAAVDDLCARFPELDIVFVESGGDNLTASFSPELADLFLFVIDVAAGDKLPRKGGPGITRSDLLVINKVDPGAPGGGLPGGHGARRPQGARRQALRFFQPEDRPGRGRDRGLHRTRGDAGQGNRDIPTTEHRMSLVGLTRCCFWCPRPDSNRHDPKVKGFYVSSIIQ